MQRAGIPLVRMPPVYLWKGRRSPPMLEVLSLASIAGIVVCGKTMTGDATIGNPYTLSSIAGTVLGGASFMGGVGTMKGAVAGALILGVLVNILFFLGLSSHYQNIAEGFILLAAVIISVLTNRDGND